MTTSHDIAPTDIQRIENLSTKIERLVVDARNKVATTVNWAVVYSHYEVGRYIVEDEQDGNYRAAYGKKILQGVSERLTERLGKGWSVENLTLMRKFYVVYSDSVTSGYEIQDKNRNPWLPIRLVFTGQKNPPTETERMDRRTERTSVNKFNLL